MTYLRFLGSAELEGDAGKDVSHLIGQPKRFALLAYLAASGTRRFHRRDGLMALFWPESSAEQARHSLRQGLYELRKHLGADALVNRGDDEVGLNEDSVTSDVAQLYAAIEHGEHERAVELYRGQFLEGFFVPGAPEVERWIEDQRAEIHSQIVVAAARLVDQFEELGDIANATAAAERAVKFSPIDEVGVRRLLTLLERQGNMGKAFRVYNRLARRLADEFDADPSPETTALISRIRESGDNHESQQLPLSWVPPPSETGANESKPERTNRDPMFGPKIRNPGIGVAIVVTLAAALLGFVSWRGFSAAPMSVNHVAIFPTRVAQDGLSHLQEGLAELIDRALDGAGEIRTIDLNRLFPLLSQVEVQNLLPEEASAYSRSVDAGLFVLSRVADIGNALKLTAVLYDTDAPNAPLSDATALGPPADLPELVNTLAWDLISELPVGEGVRLSDISTVNAANYEALKAYLEGESAFRRLGSAEAIEAYERAVEADSTFALAWYRKHVAESYATNSLPSLQKALQYEDKLRPRDRAFAHAYHAFYFGENDLFDSLSAGLTLEYPQHAAAWQIRGEYFRWFGWRKGEPRWKAVYPLERALALDPNRPETLFSLGTVYRSIGEKERGREYMRQYLQTNPGFGRSPGVQRRITQTFEGGDREARQRLTAELPNLPDGAIVMATRGIASGTGLGGAQIESAIEVAQHLIVPTRLDIVRGIGHLHLAYLNASIGRWNIARDHFGHASKFAPTGTLVVHALLAASPFVNRDVEELVAIRDTLLSWDGILTETNLSRFGVTKVLQPHVRTYLLGIVEGRLGNADEADRYADSLAVHIGSEHLVTGSERTSFMHDFTLEVRAVAALARWDSAGALRSLEQAKLNVTPADMEASPTFSRRWYGWFLRAELLTLLQRGDEAIPWYVNFGYPTAADYVFIPWSFYRRGQIFERAGVADSAIAYYGRFVDLWSQADDEYQDVVNDARTRLQVLQRSAGKP